MLSITRRTSSQSTSGEWSVVCPIRERIDEAIALLKEAQRPVILAGGGVHYSEAWDELEEFAEGLGIPVAETFAGKGAIRNRSPLALGGHGLEGTGAAATIVSQADLVISIGTRLTDFATGSQSCFNHPDVRFISINVCSHDAYKQGALPITADAREALRACYQARQARRASSRGRLTWTRSPRPVLPGTKRWSARSTRTTKARR